MRGLVCMVRRNPCTQSSVISCSARGSRLPGSVIDRPLDWTGLSVADCATVINKTHRDRLHGRCPIIGSPPPEKSSPAYNLPAKICPPRRPPERGGFYR